MTWHQQISSDGEYRRKDSIFRRWIGEGAELPADADRYHLYVSYACPWAHRTLITRKLKGLEHVLGVSVVHSFLGEEGWTFDDSEEGATGDPLNGYSLLREAYHATDSEYDGSITVPVLWDKASSRVVNNESSEIIRMLNSAFQEHAKNSELDLFPEHLRAEIEGFNDWIYATVNNGVYRCGFARSQEAYDKAAKELFASLDRLEEVLSRKRYLCGEQLTEADIRLIPTLLRFDSVYVTHFKCNIRRIVDYPNLWGYVRDLYSLDAVRETTNLDHIKNHYFRSHSSINPFGIVPRGPELNFGAPHSRADLP